MRQQLQRRFEMLHGTVAFGAVGQATNQCADLVDDFGLKSAHRNVFLHGRAAASARFPGCV